MTKKEEEWTVHDIVVICALCCLCYGAGIVLLYIKSLLGLGLIIIPTLFIIPALIEAKKKLKNYLKERRRIKRLLDSEQIIIGGTPQKHHKKKKREPDVFDYPSINDETSKGKLMEELGLFYEKRTKKASFTETDIEEHTKSTTPNRTYSQLNELFDALNHRKRIRIAHDANIGSGHHGGSIKRMVEAEAKRRGVSISTRMKGKDIVIEMERSPKRVV